MATWTIKAIEVAQAPPGLEQCLTLPEAASQDFKKGSLVRIGLAADTGHDGQIIECAGAADEKVLGIAMHDASGTTDADVVVFPIIPGVTRLRVCVTGANGSDSAVTAQADVGKDASIINTAGVFTVNKAAIGSNAAYIFKIVQVDPKYTVGDAYGRYICMLKAANSQLMSL